LVQIGPHAIDRAAWDWDSRPDNPFWCPDPADGGRWADYLDGVRKAGSSAGAVIEIVASGVPAGLGEPVYDKLDGDLAARFHDDQRRQGGRDRRRLRLGGALAARRTATRCGCATARSHFCRTTPAASLGGISTGQDIVVRLRGQADQLDPAPDAHRRQRRQRGRDRDARPHDPASASAPCRSAKR
jgi:chorismate synthase